MENKQIKILAIDDNFDNLTTIQALIAEAFPTASVLLATSGLEGLEKTASELPDVILLDIIMPIMDGYEVCRELKSNSNLADIPVVFVTALQGDKESRILGLEVGAEAFLSKPIDQSELVAQIRAMLKIKQAVDYKRNQNEYLSKLVEDKTKELKQANVSTLNLLEDIQNQIESRILIEQSLRESEEKYRFMAENTSDVIWHLDNNFSFDYISPAIEQMQGYKPDELIGKHLFSIMSDEGIRQIQEVSSGVAEMQLKGKLPKEMKFEYEAICKDGSLIWVEVNVSIHFENEMKPAGFHGVTRDISKRKKDELALIQSEEKYRSLVENSPNGIAIYQDGKFVYVNATGLKLFGVEKAEQLLGKTILSIVHPDSMDAVLRRVSQVSSGGHVPPLEEKLIRNDGSVFYGEVTSLATTFNGKHAGQVIVNDITDRKLAEEKLVESEEKFRDMTNLLPQVVFEIDLDGTINYVNQKTETLFGYEINELIGKNSLMVHVPEEYERIKNGIAKGLVGISVENREFRMVRKDGSEFPALVFISPIIKDNCPIGIRGVVVDITEQKNAEAKIARTARLYAFQSQINQAVISSKNQENLFQTICQVAVQYGGFKMSWISVYDEIEKKLKPVCHAGFNDGYIESLNITPGDKETGRGPTGLSYHEDRVIFCNDIATDDMMKLWREGALKRGYKSSFATPISRNKKSYATFTLYASEKDYFQKDEQNLLFETAKNISFALDVFDSEYKRKFSEIALFESESKYRNLMDNSPEGITIYVDGKVVYINNEALRLMKATDKNEMLGKTIVDFIHPDNVQLVLERMKLVAMAPINSIFPSVEEKYIRLDGTEVFVEIKVMPILYEGQPAIQLAGHDITDRKEAEFALEQSRVELQTIYDSAPVMMCVVNEERQIQFANNAFATLTGISEEIMRGGAVGGVIGCINSRDDSRGCGYGPKCGTCTLRMAMQKTFLTGVGQTNVEYQSILDIGGVSKNVSLLGSTALINNDGSKRLLLCMIDISDRKLTEDALQKSETLLRAFIDNSPFEIWARDVNSVGILENKKLTDHYGSIIGHSTLDDPRIDNETIEMWERINTRVFNKEILDEEYEFIVNGEPRQFQQIVFPINNNGKIIGIAGFNIDITDRKVSENALVESQGQLANFAGHLQNVREEERGILAREIHDDLGQILIAMKIDIGLLKNSVMKTILPAEFEILRSKFEDLNKLVDNTLKSARRIMTDLRPEVLEILGYVETVTQHLMSYQERTKIVCIFSNNVANLELNTQQSVALYRIVQEALNNTAKYSRATEVNIILNQLDNYLTLEISDNGVGFDMKDPKKRDSYGLMGMKERVVLLKGKLDILSAPNSGTLIKVIIPYLPNSQQL
ncbi:MAG: PAS domain S-box protein [Paludibacter sp.]